MGPRMTGQPPLDQGQAKKPVSTCVFDATNGFSTLQPNFSSSISIHIIIPEQAISFNSFPDSEINQKFVFSTAAIVYLAQATDYSKFDVDILVFCSPILLSPLTSVYCLGTCVVSGLAKRKTSQRRNNKSNYLGRRK